MSERSTARGGVRPWEPVLCGACLVRAGFTEFIEAAEAGGFRAVTLWERHIRLGLRAGMSVREMRQRLDDVGVTVLATEAYRLWSPAEGAAPTPAPRDGLDPYEVTAQLGATQIGLAYNAPGPYALEPTAEAYAAVCDRAAAHGLVAALEFVPFLPLATLADARAVVATAGRPNAGLIFDTAHYTVSGGEPKDLAELGPDEITLIQVADGPAPEPGADLAALAEDAATRRTVAAGGAMRVVEQLRALAAAGVHAPLSVEVYRPEFEEQDPVEVVAELHRGLTQVASAAGVG